VKYLLSLLLGCLIASAQAVDLTAGVGASHTTLIVDGFWYQQALPHTLQMNSFAWRIGVSQRVSSVWSASISYANNGVQHSNAIATTDAGYDNKNHVCLSHPCLPTARFVGIWSANGVAASVDWHWRDWSVGTGPYFYSPKSVVTTLDYVGYPPPTYVAIYRSSGTTHLGTDTNLSYHWRSLTLRGDSYLVCPLNRCKSELIPPYIGRHVFTVTANWSLRL
jgi:hypothetical protein